MRFRTEAVKYSRGARSTDPPEIVEDGGGEFRYVTLAVFRGDGKRREDYAASAAEERERIERAKAA